MAEKNDLGWEPGKQKENTMSLYADWRALCERKQSEPDFQQFWQEYFEQEKEVYRKVLEDHDLPYTGTVAALAEGFGMDPVTFAGYLDGANTSFASGEKDLEALTEDSEVTLDFDFEKLYYNMHEAKADWLFNLPEWNEVLSEEKRHEITKAYRASKVFVNQNKVGRNDPCPCGSGKKYKNCCGKNA